MPFLLPTKPKTDLHKYIATCFFPAPLLILFQNQSPSNKSKHPEFTCAPNGVFCGVMAHLLSEEDWVISRVVDSNSVVCMAHNIVILSHDHIPAKITLVNKQDCFEVYLEADDAVASHFCPELRQAMLAAVKHVLRTFNYSNSNPLNVPAVITLMLLFMMSMDIRSSLDAQSQLIHYPSKKITLSG